MPVDLNNFVSGARSIAGTAANTLGTVVNSVNTLKTQGFGAFGSSIAQAIRGKNLLPGGMTGKSSSPTSAIFSSNSRDWRVRLNFPPNFAFITSPLLRPLIETQGLVFPYTPQIQITHSANYSDMSPVHNNYPFLSYENSKVDNITINAPFYVEDSLEAAYWVACMHFLKAATKMQFGEDSNAGAPPPIFKLNGYGDYVFKDVPVVVKSFTMDLPNDSDYISTGLAAQGGATGNTAARIASQVTGINFTGSATAQGVSWAPVKSTINITVVPLYTRQQVRNFSLEKFVSGDYVIGSTGNKTGFI